MNAPSTRHPKPSSPSIALPKYPTMFLLRRKSLFAVSNHLFHTSGYVCSTPYVTLNETS